MTTAAQVTLYAKTGTMSPGQVRQKLEAAAAQGKVPVPDRIVGAESAGLPAGWVAITFPGATSATTGLLAGAVQALGVEVRPLPPTAAGGAGGAGAGQPGMALLPTPTPGGAAPPPAGAAGPAAPPPAPDAPTEPPPAGPPAQGWAALPWWQRGGIVVGVLGVVAGGLALVADALAKGRKGGRRAAGGSACGCR